MVKFKNLEYKIIDESLYHGEGHIINIAKRHTNRRWRQYTPEKQCNIELQLVKLSQIQSIELKGFGTFIIEISFKDEKNQLVTQLKFNLNFEEEDINQTIICDQPVKFVDIKLINNEANPRRMGINHFFMKGQTVKLNGQQSDDDGKKKKKKPNPSEIWVRQKTQNQDPWEINEISSDSENQAQPKSKGSKKKKQSKDNKSKAHKTQPKKQFLSKESQIKNPKRQNPSKSPLKTQNTFNKDQLSEISRGKKKSKLNEPQIQQIDDIKLETNAKASINKKGEARVSLSKKFQTKFNLNKKSDAQTIQLQTKDIALEKSSHSQNQTSSISQEQRKKKAKMELIKRLQEKLSSKGAKQ